MKNEGGVMGGYGRAGGYGRVEGTMGGYGNMGGYGKMGGYGGVMGGVMGQIRGMKVRSSVKKMCEGCKVCLISSLIIGFSARMVRGLGFWLDWMGMK